MILSALPGATCIMKADIVNSVFFGAAARVAGYIRNTPLRTMVQLAMADLRQGSHVLLFPEGTRTTRFPVGSLQGTTGLIAKHAGVPVQTVFIETDSGFLGKGWSLLWTPRMPITYRIRLGKRFDPPSHTAHFVGELEQYFQSRAGACAAARLPRFAAAWPDTRFHASAMNSTVAQRLHHASGPDSQLQPRPQGARDGARGAGAMDAGLGHRGRQHRRQRRGAAGDGGAR